MASIARYCTVAELMTQVNKGGAAGPWTPAALDVIIGAVSRAIDNYCHRSDGFVASVPATARYYPGSGKAWQPIDDTPDVSAVAVKDSVSDDETAYVAWVLGTVGGAAGADVFPASGNPKRPNYTRTPYTLLICTVVGNYRHFTGGGTLARIPTVEVTANWGFAFIVPDPIREACIVESARFVKRGESAWADTLASAEMGELIYAAMLDPVTKFMLSRGGFTRPRVGWATGG